MGGKEGKATKRMAEDADVPVISLRRAEDGRWAWMYRENDLSIESANRYDSADEAADAARSSYPGVRITSERAPHRRERPGILTRLLMSAVVFRRTRSG